MKASTLKPKVILGIAAHPDDIDYYAGGTVAKWAAAGVQVHFLVLTGGGRGTADIGMGQAELVSLRQAEQRLAANILGVAGVAFGGFEDGSLENIEAVRRIIVHHLRTLRPDVVIAWDPNFWYAPELGLINHADHRAAGAAALEAVYPLARDHLSFPELLAAGEEPHKVSTVLLMRNGDTNFDVDVSDHLSTKKSALAAHESQPGLKKLPLNPTESFIRIDVLD